MQIIIKVIILLCSYYILLTESNDWIQTMVSKANAEKGIFQFTEIQYKTNVNYSFYQYHRIDNTIDSYDVITRNHHHWCPLYREGWFCNGSHYEDVLKHTLRFNNEFALDKIYPNSNIFIEGNLFFTQVVITWICESMSNNSNNDALLWKISSQKRNHLLAYIPNKNIAILLYEYSSRHTTLQITEALTNIGYIPSKIILSRLTSDSLMNVSPSRYNDYYTFLRPFELEPDIILVNHFSLSDQCSSKYHNCSKHNSNLNSELDHHMSISNSYQCTPGPILRDAEELGKLIIFHSYLTTNITLLFNHSTIQSHYYDHNSTNEHFQITNSSKNSNNNNNNNSSYIYNYSIEWFNNMKNISEEHNLFQFQDKIQYLHDPNYTLHDYRMYNASVYEEVVTRNKHHWCALYRDNYCCVGDRYESILQKTIPLRDEFTIDKLAPNTRIYMEGNSHLAEIIQSWVCESNYYIQQQYNNNNDYNNNNNNNNDYNNNNNKTIKDILSVYQLMNDSIFSLRTGEFISHSSSLFIHLPYHNISIFILDNYDLFNRDTLKTISALKTIGYIPTIINIGRFNFERKNKHHTVSNRYDIYIQAFPNTSVNVIHEKLPSGCQSDFKDCYNNFIYGPHQCLPGPIFRYTEFFAEEMIKYSYHSIKL